MKTKIKDLNINIRPRERLKKYGVENLSDDELLAILLGTGSKELNAKELAQEVIKKLHNLNDLANVTLSELTTIKGIGPAKAISILSAIELGKRVLKKDISNVIINNNEIVYDLLKYDFVNTYQEKFIALYLDTKNKLISYETIFIGTVSSSTIHPREIFKQAIKYSASSIIIVHNHPSGNSTPSKSDIEITKKIISIGEIMSIPVIDHLIIGYNNYYSFYDKRKIEIYE